MPTGFAGADEPSLGTLTGIVVDKRTGDPLIGALVELAETPSKAATGSGGAFTLTAPAGLYRLDVTYPLYNVASVDVTITTTPSEAIRVEMTPRAVSLGNVVVTARALPATHTDVGLLTRQQRSSFINDSISAQWMGRISAGDAGDALKRVTGISIVGGKYVYVRGLGERYSNTQLNNVPIPSPEPNRRVVPMDIFPSSLLDSIETVKTFTPDQPADFSGGSVRIVSKDFPSAFEFSFSASSGANSQATGKSVLRSSAGSRSVFGFENGSRDLPAMVRERAATLPIREKGLFTRYGFTTAEIQQFGRAFRNEWSPRPSVAPADQGYKLSIGNSTRLFGKRFGYLGALTYDNGFTHTDELRRTYRTGADASGTQLLTPSTDYTVQRTTQNISWGTVGNASIEIAPEQKISLRTVASHSADDEARYWIGFNSDRNTDMTSTRLLYVERGILSSQLAGDHRIRPLHNASLTWRAVYSRATRNEPDTREVVYERRDDKWFFRDMSQSGSRFYFSLDDVELAGMLDFSTSVRFGRVGTGKFKTGGVARNRDRAFDARRFRFQPGDGIDRYVDLTQPPEELFKAENIAPDRFMLTETTRATDNYDAIHDVYAGYAMLDLNVATQWNVVFGARTEFSHQVVTTFDPFSPDATPIVADLRTTDLLPSLNVKYALSERVNLRWAMTRTVTRPDLREMAPFEFTDFVGGSKELGNPNLNRTLITNYDFRWELFPKPGEVVAVSAFYKHLQQPIEAIIIPQAEVLTTYANADGARNFGAELEMRRSLGSLHNALRAFFVNTNVAFISSRVRIPRDIGTQTSNERPLQGQSPYVMNAAVGYDNRNNGVLATLAYNAFGRRIEQVGHNGLPDVYESPRHQFDLTVGRTLADRVDVKLTAKNLFDTLTVYKQGNHVVSRYRSGRSFSLSASHDF
jgi:TonB-dependent receptor